MSGTGGVGKKRRHPSSKLPVGVGDRCSNPFIFSAHRKGRNFKTRRWNQQQVRCLLPDKATVCATLLWSGDSEFRLAGGLNQWPCSWVPASSSSPALSNPASCASLLGLFQWHPGCTSVSPLVSISVAPRVHGHGPCHTVFLLACFLSPSLDGVS